MTRKEFIRELNNNIRDLGAEEQSEIIRYYEEIFDGAEENGDDIHALTEKLGSPYQIAQEIKKESGILAEIKETNSTSKKYKNVPNVAMIVLAILASPIWISLLISMWAIVFTFVLVLFCIVVCFFCSALALVFFGFVNLITTTFSGFIILGMGLVAAGIFIFLRKPLLSACKYISVKFWHFNVWLFKSVFIKKAEVA
jgi:uncharacterized membrane protein